MYLLRLDDAAEYLNIDNWAKMEKLLDKYSIKPIVGLIPCVKDEELKTYDFYPAIWEKARAWQKKGWTIALHGYSHVFETKEGGINPVNFKSEFAGLSLDTQKQKIKNGYSLLERKGVYPNVFFAPAHTFDKDTIRAVKDETPIRIISDTVAYDTYYLDEMYFIPQQSGKARKLPFKTVTFCYHPNIMSEVDFQELESFLAKYQSNFCECSKAVLKKRKKNFMDIILSKMYFLLKTSR